MLTTLIGKFKGFLIGGLALAASIFYAIIQRQRADYYETEANRYEKANKNMIDVQRKNQETDKKTEKKIEKAKESNRRDYFDS